jgi:sugar diacid utilization regulator
MRGAVAAVVLRASSAGPEVLTEAVHRRIDLTHGTLRLGRDDLRMWLPYANLDNWNATLNRWHAQLSEDVGELTIGYALCRRGADTSGVEQTILRAAEAALAGERLFGAGQVTSYPDAQMAKFLLGQHDIAELRSLYERAVGKLAIEDMKQDSQLVSTLEVYCESFVSRRTAERLGVHRNTVLYRLKRIEEITSADLEDGPTRLLMQFGLLAGRMLRRSAATRSMISVGCDSSADQPTLLKVAV